MKRIRSVSYTHLDVYKRQVDIFTYDASATLNTKASDAQREEFMKTVSEREGVTGTIEVCEVNVDLVNGRKTRSANLYVPSDVQGISDFLTLRDRKSQEVYEYPREGVALSEKTAKMPVSYTHLIPSWAEAPRRPLTFWQIPCGEPLA